MQETSLVTYHSAFNKETQHEIVCGLPVLPLKGGSGPAPKTADSDIVDEAITLFRATILFKNFKPEGPADKLVVYLTCFIQKCLWDIMQLKSSDEANSRTICTTLAKKGGPASTDNANFMRKLGLLSQPAKAMDEKKYCDYLMQLRLECAERLVTTIYAHEAMDLKFWLGFGRRPFLGQKFE